MTGLNENLTLSEEQAAHTFMRAAELDGAAGSALSVKQVRQIAIEAGISPRSVEIALGELAFRPARDEPARLNEPGRSGGSAPAWVRFCMFGVPDRRIATGYYWLFVAGLIAIPVLRLFTSAEESGATNILSTLGMVLFAFAVWSTSRTIRWLDQNGWSTLRK